MSKYSKYTVQNIIVTSKSGIFPKYTFNGNIIFENKYGFMYRKSKIKNVKFNFCMYDHNYDHNYECYNEKYDLKNIKILDRDEIIFLRSINIKNEVKKACDDINSLMISVDECCTNPELHLGYTIKTMDIILAHIINDEFLGVVDYRITNEKISYIIFKHLISGLTITFYENSVKNKIVKEYACINCKKVNKDDELNEIKNFEKIVNDEIKSFSRKKLLNLFVMKIYKNYLLFIIIVLY